MVERVISISYIVTNTETEALMLEATLIKRHQPKYNILLKDWKDHSYIKITSEAIPRVIKTRTKTKNWTYFWPYLSWQYVNNLLKIAKKIFGYRSCKLIFLYDDEALKIKNKNIKIPCMDYYIWRCSWPCLLEKKYIDEYSQAIIDIKAFLKWDYKNVKNDLEKRMKKAAENLDFETAQTLKLDIESLNSLQSNQIARDWVKWNYDILNYIEKYWKSYLWKIEILDGKISWFYAYQIENKLEESMIDVFEQYLYRNYFSEDPTKKSKIILNSDIKLDLEKFNFVSIEYSKMWTKLDLIKLCYKNLYEYAYKKHLDSLSTKSFTKQNMLSLLKILWYTSSWKDIIFECNDISHISGNHTVASRSVIENGKLNKSKYRKLKIKSLEEQKIDDFWSMREVVERRILEISKHQNAPDLLIIDGWKWQLSAVMDIIKKKGIKDLQLIWIAKKEEELFLPWKKDSILLAKDSAELRMIQKLRDEAHRFAITFNRDSRIKAMKKNVLEAIPGIGPKTRKKLIQKYGNIENLKSIPRKELSEVIGKNVIEALEDHGII